MTEGDQLIQVSNTSPAGCQEHDRISVLHRAVLRGEHKALTAGEKFDSLPGRFPKTLREGLNHPKVRHCNRRMPPLSCPADVLRGGGNAILG